MRMRRVFRWFFLFADRDPTILPGRREKRRWESMIAGVGTLGTDTSYCFPRLICSCSIQDNIYSDLFPTTLIFKQTLSSFQLMIFPRLMLKINTFNKLLAERSLDSHMLWKGALRWDLNNVKKAFHLNDNQLIMIISQCRIQGRGPGGPGPPISGAGWPPPPPPPYLKAWIHHCNIYTYMSLRLYVVIEKKNNNNNNYKERSKIGINLPCIIILDM